jgi:hypothetical protein
MPPSDIIVVGKQYRLRAGTPMSKGDQGGGNFVVHTFMAEVRQVTNFLYTISLPSSKDFRGQGGVLLEARYQRLQDASNESFSGSKTEPFGSGFVEEDQIV